jgi:pimeloyl-ACP methyl ester carboxylesterase
MDLIVDGKRVFAATGGVAFDPARPAVVFLHGAGMDRTVWTHQTRWFAWHGRSVLAIDFPGHGRSDGPALDTIDALADWTVKLVVAAGLASAALVGHSMGALVALEAAARAPERVRALALLGAALEMPVHAELLQAGREGRPLARELIANWGLGQRAQIGLAETPGVWLTGATLRLLERGAKGLIGVDLAACERYTAGAATAARVRCPTLVVIGATDRMSPPKAGAAMAAAIPGARAASIPLAGHMMMIERPGDTLDALKGFL